MTSTFDRRFVRTAGAALVLAGALVASACIVQETRSVMYLNADGTVTWSLTQSDVRSDAETPAERTQEEADWRRQMLASPAPLVTRLESLGGYSVTRTVLKDEAPFEVHTIARFDRIDVLFERICTAAGYLCAARLETAGGRTTLTVEVIQEIDSPGPEKDVLTDLLDNLTLVCVDGRFVGASGFTLDGSRKATIADQDGPDEGLTLTLTWEK